MSTKDISPVAKIHRNVQVTSQPSGARIFKDDDAEPACETPCTLQAEPGTYKLQLYLTGYTPETLPLQVAGKNVELDVPMKLVRSSVVMVAPPDAALKVNGALVSNPAPIELSLLPGIYRFTAEIGGAVRERVLNVKPEAHLRLEWK